MWYILQSSEDQVDWFHSLAAADLKNAPGAIYQGEPKGAKAACTFTLSDEDFMALAEGKMDPQQVP